MNIFAALPTPAGNGPGAAVNMTAFGSVKTITVANLAGALVGIEVSNDPAALSWTRIPGGTFQTVPEKTYQVACHWMRAVVSNYQGGGAPVVEVGGTDDGTLFAVLPVPAGDGIGAPIDVSLLGVFKSVQVVGTYSGMLTVEVSEDGGASWALAFSFPAGALQTQVVAASKMRVVRTGVGAAPGSPRVFVAAVVPGGVIPAHVQNPMAPPGIWQANGIEGGSSGTMNLPESQFNDLRTIRVGSLVGIRARLDFPVITGTITAEVTLNGAGTGFTTAIGAGEDTKASTAAIGAFPYAAGDRVGLTWTTSADYLAGGNYIECWIEVEEEI